MLTCEWLVETSCPKVYLLLILKQTYGPPDIEGEVSSVKKAKRAAVVVAAVVAGLLSAVPAEASECRAAAGLSIYVSTG
ncbi:hypothetical protein KPP03845_300084 (plasmid) [Streptomyces xanthophaeus]|nr:hypothetical protein KPP03845_300084 [Streptomyces xanthophaeus]